MTLDPTYPLYPVCGFIFGVLVLVPLPWHVKAMNVGTVMFMLWTALFTFCQAINAVIWSNDYDLKALGWCDFSTRIYMAASLAVPCCTVCIQRRLHNIAVIRVVTITKREKIKSAIFDLILTLLLPLIYLVFYYIVEGHRADIIENIGCKPTVYNTPWAYVLVYMPPILFEVISFCYAALTLRAFIIRRAQFMEFISTNSTLNFRQYTRLMAIAIIEMIISIPTSAYFLYANTVMDPIAPWYSWDYVHYDWSYVGQVPASVWRTLPIYVAAVYTEQWLSIVMCFTFFVLFGFSEDARKSYSHVFWSIARIFGRYPQKLDSTFSGTSSSGQGKSGFGNMSSVNGGSTLPIFISQRKVVKRDSFLTSAGELTSSFEVEAFDEEKGSPTPSISDSSLPLPKNDFITLPQLPSKSAPSRPTRSDDLQINLNAA